MRWYCKSKATIADMIVRAKTLPQNAKRICLSLIRRTIECWSRSVNVWRTRMFLQLFLVSNIWLQFYNTKHGSFYRLGDDPMGDNLGAKMTAQLALTHNTRTMNEATDALANMADSQNEKREKSRFPNIFGDTILDRSSVLLESRWISADTAWSNWCSPFIAVNLYL